jgi:1-acyl-sn-glycerol-3-phosphate acyltransferase
MKEQVYSDPRTAEEMAPYHEYARTHEPGWTYTMVRIIFTPMLMLFYRARARGRENIPAEGPMIIAPNHFSNMDTFFCGIFMRRRMRFMSKSQFFGANFLLSYIFKNAGHFPVRRGAQDDEAFITAHSILERGGCLGIYAEGGRSRTGGFGKPKSGVGRLALQSGAPVVPVAIHGSLGVRGWRRGRFPKVRVVYGEPLTFEVKENPTREDAKAVAEEIFASIVALYESVDP